MPAGPLLLQCHLASWLGHWPPRESYDVVGWPPRDTPGWDGALHPLVVVGTPQQAVLSVPPGRADAVRAVLTTTPGRLDGAALAPALGRPGWGTYAGVFRWSTDPVPAAVLADAGEWVPHDAPGVPAWLRPFGGEVLLVREGSTVLAGVGIKRHDGNGAELAVGTDEAARGRGLARRLVAQAARRVVDEGAVATYLHDPGNVASARVADAAGFPDRGWRVWGLFEGGADAAADPAA